jgi:hypothetical protein
MIVFTIAHNRPDFIPTQIALSRRFVAGMSRFIVFDNADGVEISRAASCAGAEVVRIEFPQDGSRIDYSMHYRLMGAAWEQASKWQEPVLYLESDLFPTMPIHSGGPWCTAYQTLNGLVWWSNAFMIDPRTAGPIDFSATGFTEGSMARAVPELIAERVRLATTEPYLSARMAWVGDTGLLHYDKGGMPIPLDWRVQKDRVLTETVAALGEIFVPMEAVGITPRENKGVGAELKKLLAVPERLMEWSGLLKKVGVCQSCDTIADEMDAKGIDWCESNIEHIVDGMEANAMARKAKLFSRVVAAGLIRMAINNARDAAL